VIPIGARARRPARAAAIIGLMASGCAVGPDYRRPSVTTPGGMAGAPGEGPGAVRITEAPPWDRWWRVFNDPVIDGLVAAALTGNQDLQAALARVRAARAVAGEAFAPLLPEVGAEGSYRYYRLSRNANPSLTNAGKSNQLFAWSADAGYEVDLFGRARRGLEAARADEAASEEDRKAVEITVAADTVEAYFDLGAAEAAQSIAAEALDTFQKSLDLVRVRTRSGIAPELDLRRAEGELEGAAASAAEARRLREVGTHRLALLLGRPPDLRLEGKPPAAFAFPPEVPVGLPSDLLLRRPDVRAAEERLRAANARIGQAKADFFPRVTIAGNFGYASLNSGTLAEPAAQLWSVGPSIRIPIFTGGATYSRWKEMEARTDEAAAVYRQVVLRAFSEVADALSGIAGHLAARDRLAAQVAAEERAVILADADYRQGLTTYLNVLDAQRTLLDAKKALLAAQRNVLADLVGLQKALGGGWSETAEDTPPPPNDRAP
jgi:NodT family efflux transporter outer membrane factor (OMF) lipoprotein